MRFTTSTVCCLAVIANAANVFAAPVPASVDLAALRGWDIVVAKDAIESEVFAAEEFQRLFKQASGIELPIVHQIDTPNQHVFIGPGAQLRESHVGFGAESFGQEDLRIIVRDDNIAIAGGRPRGTLYGVYSFLEDYVGVRFLTVDHTHVPSLGAEHKIGPVDRFYHPPFDYRWVAYEANYQQPEFATRLRLNAARLPACPVAGNDWKNAGKYGGRTSMADIGHSFNLQLPPEKYARAHPEYYCLCQGKRYATLKPGYEGIDFKQNEFPYGMQPCLANRDVRRIITENVLQKFASRPDLLNVSVAANDGGAHCQCPDCAAIDQREGTKMGALLDFVNEVADEVAHKYPDRMVSTLAYSDTAPPPKTARPRDNVQVCWCSISACFTDAFSDSSCEQNERQIGQLRQWAKLTPHLYAWHYYMNDEQHGYQLPLPNLRLIDDNIRFQKSLGVCGMFMQCTSSCHGNEFEDLRNYLLSNLMWDPDRDGDQLMHEWLDLHYGAAAPIRRWIDRLHDRTLASGKHCRCLGGKYSDYGLDESDAQFGLDAVNESILLAGDNQALRRRVEKASIWAYRAALEPIWYVEDGKTLDPALAKRMQPLANRFFELCKKQGAMRTAEGDSHDLEIFETRLHNVLAPWDAS